MIKGATDAILQQQLAGLEHQDLVEDSLVSLLFCDYAGDLQRNRVEGDITKLRLHHTLEFLIEKGKGIDVVVKDEKERDRSERFGETCMKHEITFLQMLDAAELLENSFAASARLLRRGTLRLLTLERRVKEATIKAIRSKRIDYVKYLNTIDKSTRIIVTENGRLGLAPTVSKLGDVVSIIEGARAPFILRHFGEGNRYRIIGQAYICDIMFGDALELQGFGFEDFIIY